jgi:hypothetical protein
MFVILAVVVLALSTWILQQQKTDKWFTEQPLPLTETHRFFDIGVVDANGDDHLDIYTSNHHFRQALLISDGQGGYRDVLSEWGLDQSRVFPLAELSFIAPKIEEPGLYIYWLGTQFIVQAHETGPIGPFQGTLQVYDPVVIKKNDGFVVDNEQKTLARIGTRRVSETRLKFSADSDAYLRIRPGGQGLPINIQIDGALRPDQIFVGRGKVSPSSLDFSLAMQDRHAMVWADYNSDGLMDVFINRGALGGMLRVNPEEVRRKVRDELLVRRADGKFEDITSSVGIEKKDCSGRHARWLDFNNDGLLDLYINCYDRHRTFGEFPKQLYIQQKDGRFRDMAPETGVDMPDQQIGSFAWIDVDDDHDVDLITLQNEGFFLYRNDGGHVSQETIYKRPLSGAQIGSTAKGIWVYDGKLTVADYDRDGDIDLFAASKRGNVLLVNQAGSYTHIDPASVGLPQMSLNASWVDYDNDGLPDLHTVPQGLFRQNKTHQFEATNILTLPNGQYQAAVSNWFDMDNDGRQDLLMALNENSSFEHWWEISPKHRRDTTWLIKSYHHKGPSGHWLQVRIAGSSGNRQAIGARVTVVTPDGEQTQEVGSSEGAFFSQGHYRLYFGMGSSKKAGIIKVRWSDGFRQELRNVNADSLLVIERVPESPSGN